MPCSLGHEASPGLERGHLTPEPAEARFSCPHVFCPVDPGTFCLTLICPLNQGTGSMEWSSSCAPEPSYSQWLEGYSNDNRFLFMENRSVQAWRQEILGGVRRLSGIEAGASQHLLFMLWEQLGRNWGIKAKAASLDMLNFRTFSWTVEIESRSLEKRWV